MTCIAAVVGPDGSVYMGGDSASVDSFDLQMGTASDAKVWRAGPLLFGVCGSWRTAQLIKYRLTVPTPVDEAMQYVTGPLVDAIREALAAGGGLTTWDDDSTESLTGAGLLVAYAGQVFEMFSDFGVTELVDGYAATGCGAAIALGTLAGTESLDIKPKKRVQLALEAAERHSAGVRGPHTILKLGAR